MNDSYELVYGSGGHGGPYFGLENAIAAAKRLLVGCKSETSISVFNREVWPGKQKPTAVVHRCKREIEAIEVTL